MSNIFISYSSKDRKSTRALVPILENYGWTVWWDKHIAPGEAFDRAIVQALEAAKCIIVLWSQNSVKSDWVMEEALEGMQRKILLPTNLDSVSLPFGFRRIQTIDLSRWDGSANSTDMNKLMDAVQNLVKPTSTVPEKESEPNENPPRRARKLTGALDGKTIVFTGALTESRIAHAEKVRTVGARFVDSVSSRTDYLVIGKAPGAEKLEAANNHNVNLLTERQWLRMLNEAYSRILQGKTVVFTGKLSKPRTQLEDLARELGAKPVESISRNTSYLIIGKDTGEKKLTFAKENNIEIMNETVWNDITATLRS